MDLLIAMGLKNHREGVYPAMSSNLAQVIESAVLAETAPLKARIAELESALRSIIRNTDGYDCRQEAQRIAHAALNGVSYAQD